MLLTEMEAQTKWCPMVRVGAYSDRGELHAITVNRDPRPEVADDCNCIASKCAMWRWYGPQHRDRLGYCGLAGEPLPVSLD